ncbi:MAG: hypothetical protein GDA36_03295 [Rhodobacteraceae bacterium]|nr:hypothetical protein [Paracoccaceae bacterium]
MDAAQGPKVKQSLPDAMASVVVRGVSGVPGTFAGNEMFFGKDSLAGPEFEPARA